MTTDNLLFIMFCVGIVFIIIQNICFLLHEIKISKQNLTERSVKQTILSSAFFSLIPAITTGLSFLPLANYLGVDFVLLKSLFTGSLQDNVLVAETSLNIFGLNLNQYPFSIYIISVLLWVMTFSGLASIVVFVFLAILKKRKAVTDNKIIENQNIKPISKLKKALKLTVITIGNLMYMGIMGVYFVKYLFAQGNLDIIGDGAGFISIVSLLFSSLMMVVLLKISEKKKMTS